MAKLIFYLNILALSPLSHLLGENSSIFLRIIQVLTFVISIQYINFDRTRSCVNIKLITILVLFVILIFISEIFHEPKDFVALLRHFTHVLYIIGLLFLLKYIRRDFLKKCLIFLVVAYLAEATYYILFLNKDSFVSFVGLNELQNFKRTKYELLEAGYTLQSFHIIPFVSLWLLPLIKSKKRQLLLLVSVFFIMFISFTFTALISYFLVIIFYIVWNNNKKIYKSSFILYLIIGSGFVIFVLIKIFPTELFKLTTGRATLWEQSVKMIIENPLWGCSMDDFYSNMESYLISGSFGKSFDSDYIDGMFYFTTGSCHNNYLGMVMNYGIPLGFIFFAFIFFLWNTAVKKTQNMIYLLPFLYLLIRGFGEFGGIIGSSSSNLDFLFDLYIIGIISIPHIKNKFE